MAVGLVGTVVVFAVDEFEVFVLPILEDSSLSVELSYSVELSSSVVHSSVVVSLSVVSSSMVVSSMVVSSSVVSTSSVVVCSSDGETVVPLVVVRKVFFTGVLVVELLERLAEVLDFFVVVTFEGLVVLATLVSLLVGFPLTALVVVSVEFESLVVAIVFTFAGYLAEFQTKKEYTTKDSY